MKTDHQLESQRLELFDANLWADQAQRENSRFVGELSAKNRIYHEHRAGDCQDIKQADRVRQLRIDELSVRKKENPSTVHQLLSKIQEL